MSSQDFGALSMLELFRLEAETQLQTLTADLLALEREPGAPPLLESCMRAAHSLKGAARIVGLNPAVSITHAMEDCFVAAQNGEFEICKPQIDLLLKGIDRINEVAAASDAELAAWNGRDPPEVVAFVGELHALLRGKAPPVAPAPVPLAELRGDPDAAATPDVEQADLPPASAPVNDAGPAPAQETTDRSFRVSAQNFNRLLGLAAQSLVEARWLGPFHGSLVRLKRQEDEFARALEAFHEVLPPSALDERSARAFIDLRQKSLACRAELAERLAELDNYERRVALSTLRLHEEALTCRMRPFADGLVAFPRLVRDLARALGKNARLETAGESTAIDRDVLSKLEAPLTHLVRNAVDHGIDPPDVRRAAGKGETGLVRIEARHLAGMLEIIVSDDGRGIDRELVRRAIVARGLADGQMAAKLSDGEIHDFLFLPGFTLRSEVTEISGRGVGLDVVQSAVKALRGSVRVFAQAGQGTAFHLYLPATLSVVRALVVDIGGDPYAFPLTQIERAVTIASDEIQTLEGRQHFAHAGRQIGLVLSHQIFGVGERERTLARVPVIIVSDREQSFGIVVDRLRGVHELAVHALDPRLGKIKDIAAGALLEDGAPVLIVDVEDALRSIEKLVSGGHLSKLRSSQELEREVERKRILVVDDSFTVRELERKLLASGGYEVEVAVDGMDGWNALRVGAFDLVVTDIDMPRMDGIDLVKLIRQDTRLRALPVMIVSYKDREQDRRRGLEAGADYYLAKGSFKNEGLLSAVIDLIGEGSA